MKSILHPEKITETLRKLKGKGKTVGFVPTMGALHEGHLSLVRTSVRENDVTAVSIFVNPLQFGPREDLKKYPRTLNSDLRKLKSLNVDYVFCPNVKEMYPAGKKSVHHLQKELRKSKRSADLAKPLCGKYRPGHFQGVRAVVLKLFQIIGPDRAYFGAKDFQQARIIEQMVRDLKLPLTVKVLPIVREADGLAMSSRNRYLSDDERQQARGLSRTLFWLRRQLKAHPSKAGRWLQEARRRLAAQVSRLQYLELVDAKTLRRPRSSTRKRLAACACFVGKTRLIDNVIITARRSKTRRR